MEHPRKTGGISLRRKERSSKLLIKNYKFVSKHPTAIARMIGNAVPPELSKRIARTILNYYNGGN